MAAALSETTSLRVPIAGRAQNLEELVGVLNADLAAGLTGPEVTRRLAKYGLNRVDTDTHPSLSKRIFVRFRNPLVLVLVAAAAISALTGDTPSLFIIVLIVGLSIVLDVIQESKAQTAAAKLRAQVSLIARVLREGTWCDIAALQLVPGDVIALTAGDLVPADCRLITVRDLYLNEALLTGEAFPAEKACEPGPTTALIPQNQAYMGTSVLSGTATALVVATGRDAQLGTIASALRAPPPETSFDRGVRDFGRMILRLTVLLVLITLFINLALHRPPLQSFLFSLALAVGLTPELLPMVMSVTLAHGALRMARKRVIVKRLSAIHDLGSMDVLCSDKTGTLTEARIALIRAVDIDQRDSPPALFSGLLNAAFETGLKSPMDRAILNATDPAQLAGWSKVDEVPFDFERRRVAVLVQNGAERRLVVKGAPEDMLSISAYAAVGTAILPMDTAARVRAEATFAALSREGFRVLGVAQQEVTSQVQRATLPERPALTFVGYLAFLDPPKLDAEKAIADLTQLGVTVKVVTGDCEEVTRHVCGELKLQVRSVLNGAEIATLSDEALQARLEDTTLFCRVTPPQKSRIIAALRRQGHVVGYLGDGINDAPSLHAADVGFSVDTGVDVAKEAASMILLEKDLGVIAEGVLEGRRTYANILKYVMMGTSSNFGNMFSMAGGALFLPFLPMLPIQILLNNLIYDFSETTIPLDRVDEALLTHPRRWDIGVVRRFMFVLGPISSLFDFLTFWALLSVFHADQRLFHASWFVESLATQILVIFLIRSAHPWRDRPHPALVLTSLIALCAAVALPFSPVGAWLGFVPIPLPMLASLALITSVYLVTIAWARRLFFRHNGLSP
jgi:Mg2+-importing ATPase